ncbi:HupE/UreJ family protein [Candidatus Woesearchaeota archaeon]|nr:HupE/UreJ family protein [Candidatus Woesearchaeota archaeon]
MISQKKLMFYLFSLILIPVFANAHLIGGNGLSSGVTHPLLGFDHLLAMIAVGIIVVQIGLKKAWVIPTAFVSSMIIGGIIAISGIKLPFVQSGFIEYGIALSVIILGLAIYASIKLSPSLAIFCISLFGIFHGHAHGTELPTIASPILYIAGFITSTILLHLLGIGIGFLARRTAITTNILKYAGLAMSLVGIAFLVG